LKETREEVRVAHTASVRPVVVGTVAVVVTHCCFCGQRHGRDGYQRWCGHGSTKEEEEAVEEKKVELLEQEQRVRRAGSGLLAIHLEASVEGLQVEDSYGAGGDEEGGVEGKEEKEEGGKVESSEEAEEEEGCVVCVC